MSEKFRRYGTPLLLSVAALWLARFPVAECFDCEFPNAWGQPDHVRHLHGLESTILMLSFSFIAGLLRPRLYWLVPFVLSTIYVLTMHLAGVEWWSVKNNEGPIEYIVGMPIDYVALGIGIVLPYVFPKIRRLMPAKFMEGQDGRSGLQP